MNKRVLFSIIGAVLCVAMVFASIGVGTSPAALSAPLAAPTPVSVTRPANNQAFITWTPFSATVLTADSTVCQEIAKYSVADILYSIDQGTTNTTTLTAKWGVADTTTLATGISIVAANVADATDMQQMALFGRYFCILADVTNTEPLTLTVQAIAK